MSITEQYLQAEMAAIDRSGLFFADWYAASHPESAAAPLKYFCETGWRQGHPPNPYFDPAYYLAANPDVLRAGLNPLVHYITHGDREGRDPCAYFHVAWYRRHYGLDAAEPALRHFLAHRVSGQVAPVPLFDPVFYLENNPDVARAGADPFEHFLAFGQAEGRDPSAAFDLRFYRARYGAELRGMNPLLHYLLNRESGFYLPQRPAHEMLIPHAIRRATRAGEWFETFAPAPATAARRAKLLAFYLPQYHTMPQNDAWWGKGFTDWTNLARAMPRFAGHLQPRVPRDLGYYALDDARVLRRQIDLALGAGLAGFVFYFYWFNRVRLLAVPLHALLADKSLDFPFCVMWANENWTRRWDGLDREVLIAQEYRDSDDAALVDEFAALFADPRYIFVAGRPVLMIYRVSLIPDAARRIARWRELFRARHGQEPMIIMAQSLEDDDPRPYGLDGAVEFPPHKICDELPVINETLDICDPEFSAKVYRYDDVAAASLALPAPDYPLIKTILPGWDNDPRREGKGLVVHGATPAKYQDWLTALAMRAAEHPVFGEPLICVNAWNEWAEGAMLEPDMHFGAAFLNATGRALCGGQTAGRARLLLVGHDAQPHGAQMLLLHLARHYARVCGFEVHLLLLGPGPLLTDYEDVAAVTLTSDKATIARQLRHYARLGIGAALVNSVASARLVPALKAVGIAATLLVHEMPKLMAEYNLQMHAKLGALAAAKLVFSSEFQALSVSAFLQIEVPGRVILAQGNYQNVGFSQAARDAVRAELGVPVDGFLILAAGFADLRKGFDTFLQIARKLLTQRADVWVVWVGDVQAVLRVHLADEIAAVMQTGRFHLPGFTRDVARYFSAADIFALPSREDPLPTVVLEALACGVPVVAFERSGGVPALIANRDAGLVAAPGDVDDFTAKLSQLLDRSWLDATKARLVDAAADFAPASYANALLRLVEPGVKAVSVAVLNYNYARFLQARMDSVLAQSYPVTEVLFLDDASDDGSVACAQAIAAAHGREIRVVANARNGGAVFAQWQRAAREAVGEFVWIAEADDVCEPEFLARVVGAMASVPDAVMGFCDSRMLGEAGEVTTPDYKGQYQAADAAMLSADGIWPAAEFAVSCLSVQNLIFNVSAVVWRREALLAALQRCGDALNDWQIAGDWRLYLDVLTGGPGKVVYVAEPLNGHRRHRFSATARLAPAAHAAEISRMHAIVAQSCRLGPDVLQRQRDYFEQVKNSAGVSKKVKSAKFKA